MANPLCDLGNDKASTHCLFFFFLVVYFLSVGLKISIYRLCAYDLGCE